MHKYRSLLGEVLVASFFLQLFALVSPLFFQVVIDKVLVHRGLTHARRAGHRPGRRLAFREPCWRRCAPMSSRTPPTASTSSWARGCSGICWRCRWPISRRAAPAIRVARVRELENIRNFLTSSALTLVIDLFFTFVFLAVMFFYSPILTWHRAGLLPVLYRDLGWRDADLPPPARREVQPRRREPGFPGRKRHRRRDAEGDGGRAADAAPLGRAARRLCRGQLPRLQPRQLRRARAIQLINKLVTAAISVLRRQGWSSTAA